MTEAFNKDELLEEIDGDMEFLAELFYMLQDDAMELLEKIKTASETGDYETVWQTAHSLKSMVGNFAAHNCHAAAYQVELAGRESRHDDISKNLPLLEEEVKNLISALTDLLGQ